MSDERFAASGHTPAMTALVCTRNRGASILLPLRSLLANSHQNFEVVVVDQSTSDETAVAMHPFLTDGRVRYIRSPTIGLGRARNIGLAEARADVVAMTDDDCDVQRDWLEKIGQAFDGRPKVAVVYCNVTAAAHDPTLGFVPSYATGESRTMTRFLDWCAPHGIGAGMAVRRTLMKQIGGYDEALGAGARFSSFEDSDVALRAFARGLQAYHTHEASVVHFGFRTWQEGRELTERDCTGIGAGYAKLLKCGQWRVALPLSYEIRTLVIEPVLKQLIRGRKPPVLVRGVSLARGFFQGLRTPVDRQRLVFVSE